MITSGQLSSQPCPTCRLLSTLGNILKEPLISSLSTGWLGVDELMRTLNWSQVPFHNRQKKGCIFSGYWRMRSKHPAHSRPLLTAHICHSLFPITSSMISPCTKLFLVTRDLCKILSWSIDDAHVLYLIQYCINFSLGACIIQLWV